MFKCALIAHLAVLVWVASQTPLLSPIYWHTALNINAPTEKRCAATEKRCAHLNQAANCLVWDLGKEKRIKERKKERAQAGGRDQEKKEEDRRQRIKCKQLEKRWRKEERGTL